MIAFTLVTMINFNDAAKYYKELPHQVDAFSWLQQCCSDEVVTEFGRLYRNAPETNEFTNDWDSVYKLANTAGAKFPELVAAQWALESGWGQHVSGKNNFFGIKGKGTVQKTWEDYGNGPVDIFDEFKDFIYNYHSNGLDLMHSNQIEAKNNIMTYLSYLKPLKRRNPNSILLKILFDAKSDEINEIFLGGPEINTEELVNDLNYLSPFFSNKWNIFYIIYKFK